jgi:hypothetical protein
VSSAFETEKRGGAIPAKMWAPYGGTYVYAAAPNGYAAAPPCNPQVNMTAAQAAQAAQAASWARTHAPPFAGIPVAQLAGVPVQPFSPSAAVPFCASQMPAAPRTHTRFDLAAFRAAAANSSNGVVPFPSLTRDIVLEGVEVRDALLVNAHVTRCRLVRCQLEGGCLVSSVVEQCGGSAVQLLLSCVVSASTLSSAELTNCTVHRAVLSACRMLDSRLAASTVTSGAAARCSFTDCVVARIAEWQSQRIRVTRGDPADECADAGAPPFGSAAAAATVTSFDFDAQSRATDAAPPVLPAPMVPVFAAPAAQPVPAAAAVTVAAPPVVPPVAAPSPADSAVRHDAVASQVVPEAPVAAPSAAAVASTTQNDDLGDDFDLDLDNTLREKSAATAATAAPAAAVDADELFNLELE